VSGYKQRVRRFALLAVAVGVLATPAAASHNNWWFKTPSGAAYCGIPEAGTWLCMRPEDGFWIRFVFGRREDDVDVRKGVSERYRGLHAPAPRTLGFGEVFTTSDAAIITCWSRRAGLTCKHYLGLSFSLGRGGGYRIFYDVPRFPLDVRPLFRTDHGIRCGIDRDTLAPENRGLQCWRADDGLLLGIAHDDAGRRGGHARYEQALGFRPPGFPLLAYGRAFVWRCRKVTSLSAERCSTREGEPVFTCTNTRAQLTCHNRNGHGFWAGARSFYTF